MINLTNFNTCGYMCSLGGKVMSETLEILMNDGCLTEDEAIDLIEEEGMDDLLDED